MKSIRGGIPRTVGIRCIVGVCLALGVGTVGLARAAGDQPDGKAEAARLIDVTVDPARLNIHETNMSPGASADQTAVLQSAIDHLAERGGGTVYLPAGVYQVAGVTVRDGVRLLGAGSERTVLRAAKEAGYLVRMTGERPQLAHIALFGTPDAARSGEQWVMGRRARGQWGEGGTALVKHVIAVRNAENATLHQVHAREARYDPLYVRDTDGLRVTHARFDRAGRNVISMVGTDRDFVFDGVRVGSLFGLYHLDIEPWPKPNGPFVRRGRFVNCTFDGRAAGEHGSTRWGAMVVLSGQHGERTRDLAFIGCRFLDVSVRVRGVVPGVRFLDNTFEHTRRRHAFVAPRTAPVGELPGAVLRGNRLSIAGPDTPMPRASVGVRFTRGARIGPNDSAAFDRITVAAPFETTTWEEDHPFASEPGEAAEATRVESLDGDRVRVHMPLRWGYGYDLERDRVVPPGREARTPPAYDRGDLVWYADPLMAGRHARLRRMDTEAGANGWVHELWGLEPGDRVVVRTSTGRRYVVTLVERRNTPEAQATVTFEYEPAAAADGGK